MNSTVSEISAYRYTGREYDEETGLHNFRARLYDSTLMRFYQVDPAEQFASPYVYCGNNPIRLDDPDGKRVKLNGNRILRNEGFNLMKTDPDIHLPLTINKRGALGYDSSRLPNELSNEDLLLKQAIDDPQILTRIKFRNRSTTGEYVDGQPVLFGGGANMGYRRDLNPFNKIKKVATMYVFTPGLTAIYLAGGASEGLSLEHEIGEGYTGAKQSLDFPQAHAMVAARERAQYKPIWRLNKSTELGVYMNGFKDKEGTVFWFDTVPIPTKNETDDEDFYLYQPRNDNH